MKVQIQAHSSIILTCYSGLYYYMPYIDSKMGKKFQNKSIFYFSGVKYGQIGKKQLSLI